MHLITGLGNPGLKYQKTRHNAGCLVIKKILTAYGLRLKALKKLNVKSTKTTIEGKSVVIATPTTFMNNSGLAVQAIVSYYHPTADHLKSDKIKPENIIVIHDDIDLPSGKIRIKDKGSAGGHNGIKSIIECLGTENFIRLKIGIGPQPNKIASEKYVLQRFSKNEQKTLQNEIIPQALNAIREILKNGVNSAMNKYN